MQMKYVTTTCPYCGTGCGLNLIVQDEKATGVAPYHRSPIGSGKLCTRGLHTAQALTEWRVEKPLVGGQPVELTAAYAEAMKLKNYAADEVAVITSSRLTNEAAWTTLKFAREVLGTEKIGVVNGGTGKSDLTIDDLESADVILAIGDVMKKLPLTGNRFYKVQENGGKILYLGPMSYTAVQADVAVIEDEYTELPGELASIITDAKNPVLAYFANDTAAAEIATQTAAKKAVLYDTCNGRGLAEFGIGPFVSDEKIKALLIITETPEMEEDIYTELLSALENIEFTVVLASNMTSVADVANVVIPIAGQNEYEGSLTNWEGRIQKVRSASLAPEGVKCLCDVLSDLSDGKLSFEDKATIFAEIKAVIPGFADVEYEAIEKPDGVFVKEA